jgi:hypothetical protein
MSVWTEARAATAALTRTVTGAILAPHETQRLVVSDKTGNYSSVWPGKSKCAPIDLGGEMVTPFLITAKQAVLPNDYTLTPALCFNMTLLTCTRISGALS